ncbi:hypothetical protein Mag101_07875 [Microbulbifer agarilyticus]|uniref:DAC domain-containing protein n=1 Tax=Microbulbifer agarilyticus TaxID=260552 RepID=A0A1Q2M4I8_9GAMM|nr:hypothetical protein [Microbulbifer agarilyticus]AQQ67570.1 hypothetical protein Mag101_07875 [Microbulbifer agarilyticus]
MKMLLFAGWDGFRSASGVHYTGTRYTTGLIVTKNEFRHLLYEVWLKSRGDFSGLGVVVCDVAADLPIVNLRGITPDTTGALVDVLARISREKNIYHDGFHILSTGGKLTHAAQYFSPPIVRDAFFDKSRIVGGRFVAALYGSAITGVAMTGIVSSGHGLSIFKNGQEVHYEVCQ